MHCIDPGMSRRLSAALCVLAAGLAGCVARTVAPPPPTPAQPAPPPVAVAKPPAPPPAAAPAPAPAYRARSMDEYRTLAARRIVEANKTRTYMGTPPEPLLAIPVLEVELNADGGVVNVGVQRPPSQALDTVQLAIDAVRRAAPFGPVGHLPRPWKFSEVFLFDDDRRFKPRSLD